MSHVAEVDRMVWNATDEQLEAMLEAAAGHEDPDVAARVVERVEVEREKRDI